MPKKGRPTLFNERVQDIVNILAPKGLTDAEMATVVGVTEQTFNNWKKSNPAFFESLKELKRSADQKVQRALFERACGYSHPEDKIFLHEGQPVIVPTTKYYPPDTTACIYWLKNRNPAEWRDKQEIEASDNIADILSKLADKLPD